MKPFADKIKLYIIIIPCFFSQTPFAQSLSTSSKKAELFYSQARNTLSPDEAIELAKKAVDEDEAFTEAYWFLSSRLRDANKRDEQIQTLETAASKISFRKDETIYKLALAYYETGAYEKCISTINHISEKYTHEKKDILLKKAFIAEEFKRHPVPYNPINMKEINTLYDDYWASLTLDGKVISTTVLIADKSKSNLEWNEEIYWSFKDKDGVWKKSESIGMPTNTEDNEGSQSFSIDGKYMFFVACDKPDTKGGCDIYYSVHDGAAWSFPINPGAPLNTRYWETNPCLSADGKELFFSSNRPGGKGKKDIWESVVTQMPDGTLRFSEPINLSDSINTKEDEFSPFFHADGKTLYFSSNGHAGLGSYDIFFSRRDEKYVWSTPKNIGYPINTHKDEYGFVVNSKGDKAYFSSDILENNGKDIYELALYEEARPEPMKYFSGLVRERTQRIPLAAEIEISDLESGKKFNYRSNEIGDFATYLPVNKEYGVNVNKKGFLFHSQNISPKDLLEDKVIIDMDSIMIGKSLVLHNISFETDSYKLLPKSKPELEQIVSFMSKQSDIEIEIVGHTDNVGTHEYNMALSRNRAKEVHFYLTQNGIAPNRMKWTGKGETEPIADNATEEGKSLNRRTELKITKQ